MGLFISEAVVVGLKEGAKLVLLWLIFYSYLPAGHRARLMRPFYAGVAAASLLVALSFPWGPDPYVREIVARLVGYVFFLFFLASVVALYDSSELNLTGPLRGLAGRPGVTAGLVFSLTVLYLAPDIIGTSMFVREISEMQGSYALTYMSAALGFAVSLAFLRPLIRRLPERLSPYFGTAQFLLFLSVLKLLGGGIKGFSELSLIPAVQRGVMKFVHDLVHQTFVFLMVPDHQILSATTWDFIGVLFGSNIALAITLLLLLTPPLMFLYKSLFRPLSEPEGMATGAERRLRMAEEQADRRRKAVLAMAFVAVIMVSWFSGIGRVVSTLYNPRPKPVIEDKGMVLIPLMDPTMDLRDGRVHKFSINMGRDTAVLMVILRPDGKLVVCLDACEVCPPEGYGQKEGYVVCIYCMTPIPTNTLGQSGGCNPIPINATITESEIRIDFEDLKSKWSLVMSGDGKEDIK